MTGYSISLSGRYSWEDIDKESKILGLDRSNFIQKCVDSYFINKKTNILQRNLLSIAILLLLLLNLLVVMLLL